MSKLSIITINYNNAAGLKKTLDSVAAQTYTDFEHIIVDGASTDGSVNEIISYSQSPIANRYKITWISEPDTGIYNAMNKGVRMAKGEYTLMLNSGDYLVDNHVIEKIIPLLDSTDIIQGNTIEEYPDKTMRNRGYGDSDIDLFDVMNGHFLHQAAFCRKGLFARYGMFDESYKVGGDTKFFMNCLGVNNATFKYIDIDVSNYDLTGISASQDKQVVTIRNEELVRIYDELFSKRMQKYIINNAKKIRLYNKLSSNHLVWCLVMAIVHVYDWFHKESKNSNRKRIN